MECWMRETLYRLRLSKLAAVSVWRARCFTSPDETFSAGSIVEVQISALVRTAPWILDGCRCFLRTIAQDMTPLCAQQESPLNTVMPNKKPLWALLCKTGIPYKYYCDRQESPMITVLSNHNPLWTLSCPTRILLIHYFSRRESSMDTIVQDGIILRTICSSKLQAVFI